MLTQQTQRPLLHSGIDSLWHGAILPDSERSGTKPQAVHGARLDACHRGQIATMLGWGMSMRTIAAALGVHPSTISREVRRHLRDGVYSPRAAQRLTDQARQRPRLSKLDADLRLRGAVVARLDRRLSPQQIAAELVKDFPDDQTMRVSHETIYQALYVQGRGSLREELKRDKALRSGRTSRIPASRLPDKSRGWLQGHHISTRPAEVADRAVPGHWEGDLIIGAHHKRAVITLVERQTRYAMMRLLPSGHVSVTVTDQLLEMMSQLPADLRKTLTWDQGSEMADHARFTLSSGTQVFFCDPRSPWQRGSKENTNGLIRDFFPKSTDFRRVTPGELAEAQHLLNTRPRQTLKWATPAEALAKLLTLH